MGRMILRLRVSSARQAIGRGKASQGAVRVDELQRALGELAALPRLAASGAEAAPTLGEQLEQTIALRKALLAVPPSGAEAAAMMEWRLHFHRRLRREGAVLLEGGLPTPAMEEEDGGSEQVLAAQEAAIEAITGLRIHECDYGKVWETKGRGLRVGSAELKQAPREAKWHSSDRVEANAARALEQHTDAAFWGEPPAVLLFHMLKPATRFC